MGEGEELPKFMSLDLKIHLLEALQNLEMAKANDLKAAFGNECESCACLGKRDLGDLRG